MGKLLSIAEVAELAGVSVGSIREWERRGLLRASRTAGGHRRFREEDVEELLADRDEETEPRATPRMISRYRPHLGARGGRPPVMQDEPGSAPPARPAPVPPWECRVREARADVLVLKARQDVEALTRAQREEETRRGRAAETAVRERQEAERLEALRSFGWSLAATTPIAWRARITRDLQSYVTSDQFPPEIDDGEAREFVRARVEEILTPYREELAEAEELERRRRRVKDLIAHGEHVLQSRQFLSVIKDAIGLAHGEDAGETAPADLVEEVRQALREDVRPDWTEENVEDLVYSVLEEGTGDEEE